MLDERTVYACALTQLPRLAEASTAVWRDAGVDLSAVTLIVGPTLAPGGFAAMPAGGDGKETWVAFAYRLFDGKRERYTSELVYELAAPLSRQLGKVDHISGDGRSDACVLGATHDGALVYGEPEFCSLRAALVSFDWGYDLGKLYGFGDFGIRGVELRGDKRALTGVPEAVERSAQPTADFSLERVFKDHLGPPGPQDFWGVLRREELIRAASDVGSTRYGFQIYEEEEKALRERYPPA